MDKKSLFEMYGNVISYNFLPMAGSLTSYILNVTFDITGIGRAGQGISSGLKCTNKGQLCNKFSAASPLGLWPHWPCLEFSSQPGDICKISN